jgi:hypothetical protein
MWVDFMKYASARPSCAHVYKLPPPPPRVLPFDLPDWPSPQRPDPQQREEERGGWRQGETPEQRGGHRQLGRSPPPPHTYNPSSGPFQWNNRFFVFVLFCFVPPCILQAMSHRTRENHVHPSLQFLERGKKKGFSPPSLSPPPPPPEYAFRVKFTWASNLFLSYFWAMYMQTSKPGLCFIFCAIFSNYCTTHVILWSCNIFICVSFFACW